MRRRVDLWLALSLLLLTGIGLLGAWNGVQDWVNAETSLQQLSGITQLLYGVLALLGLLSLLFGWRGLRPVMTAWFAAMAVSGGLAPIAWGGATIGEGIAVMILSGVAGLGVLWIVRRARVPG